MVPSGGYFTALGPIEEPCTGSVVLERTAPPLELIFVDMTAGGQCALPPELAAIVLLFKIIMVASAPRMGILMGIVAITKSTKVFHSVIMDNSRYLGEEIRYLCWLSGWKWRVSF